MKCATKNCRNEVRWKEISILIELNICDNCRKKLEKEFKKPNHTKTITWYYYKTLNKEVTK